MIQMQKQRWIAWAIFSCLFSVLLFLVYVSAHPIFRNTELALTIIGSALFISLFLLLFMWYGDTENRKDKLLKEGYVAVGANGNGETYWVKHYERVVMVCTVNTKDYIISEKRYEKSELETIFSLQDKIR